MRYFRNVSSPMLDAALLLLLLLLALLKSELLPD
jgi:hypothetical protein